MSCIQTNCCFEMVAALELDDVTLPIDGGYTTQDFTSLPTGTREVTYWITYERGDAPGAAAFRLEATNGTDNARELIQDNGSFAAAAPEGTVNVYLETLNGPAPADANPIVFFMTFALPAGTTGVRLLAAEYGLTATPGTVTTRVTGRA